VARLKESFGFLDSSSSFTSEITDLEITSVRAVSKGDLSLDSSLLLRRFYLLIWEYSTDFSSIVRKCNKGFFNLAKVDKVCVGGGRDCIFFFFFFFLPFLLDVIGDSDS
jgi:hypothetical protein